MDNIRGLNEATRQEANRLGFELVGITTPQPPPHVGTYLGWIAQGRHASMAYLATDRAIARRKDPAMILPGCRSVVIVGIRHPQPRSGEAAGPRIAAYALAADYHELIPARLEILVGFLKNRVAAPFHYRIYTDTGPVLERDLAQRAGLGWIGKNTCLIHPRHGSYFLLGEVFLTLPLEPDAPFSADHCGTCTRCLESCPTRCIRPDRTLDASRCISYLTIENRAAIPEDLRPAVGEWLFGCDICQQVCPWNTRFSAPSGDPDFQPAPARQHPDPEPYLDPQRAPALRGTALARARTSGLARNAAVVLGNGAAPETLEALARALHHPTPLIRQHAAWALGRLQTEPAWRALRERLINEGEPEVEDEIRRALRRAQGRGEEGARTP